MPPLGIQRLCTRHHIVRLLVAFAILTIVSWLWLPHARRSRPIINPFDHKHRKRHPIDHLISDARSTFDALTKKQTTTLNATAEAYRHRRGRHPPPGFDTWFTYAKNYNAVIVEDFFDQIYHDLNPFWGIPAKQIRQHAHQFSEKIIVRNGTVLWLKEERAWMKNWIDMVGKIQHLLPDLDMPINLMDEPRVIVPWEEIERYVQAERDTRNMLRAHNAIKDFSAFDVDIDPGEPVEVEWIREGPYWDTARVGCAPGTPARQVPSTSDFSGPPPVHCTHITAMTFVTADHCSTSTSSFSYGGYISNWTAAKDPCLQPELRESHGGFVEPVSKSTTRSLIPLFGGSKLPMNNDILIPAAMYWPDKSFYSTGGRNGDTWETKATSIMWRGAATGGRNREENWTRFHRHRFVSLMNGTQVQMAEHNRSQSQHGPNFKLEPYQQYRNAAALYIDLGTWLDNIADVGFNHLVCFPDTGNAACPYTDPFFSIKKIIPMDHQYDFKYLADLDGNSFSGRYLAFLRSTSLPIKATIYSEWHDSRLIPWLHFVPMHNSFVDIYGILEYFIGINLGVKTQDGQAVMEGGHDAEAKAIAMAGKEWAEKVLRKEDMLIYVLRLLLEYARVCDDERERLGFVADREQR